MQCAGVWTSSHVVSGPVLELAVRVSRSNSCVGVEDELGLVVAVVLAEDQVTELAERSPTLPLIEMRQVTRPSQETERRSFFRLSTA